MYLADEKLGSFAVGVPLRGMELTARVLYAAGRTALAEVKKHYIDVKAGEQSLGQLNKQQRELESVKIEPTAVKEYRRALKEYELDFALKKGADGKFWVFYKGQDAKRVHQALGDMLAAYRATHEDKEPVEVTIKDAETRAAEAVRSSRDRNTRESPELTTPHEEAQR